MKWFLPLQGERYFDPSAIPYTPEGYTVFWQVLDYLERVSEQVFNHPEYGKKLLEIVDNIVEFSENKRRINNYHVWWYCVKILNNIPFDIIKEYLSVERFHIWLSVWTNRSMVADLGIVDIGIRLLPKFLENGVVNDNKYEYAETIIDVITAIKIRRVSGPSRSWWDVILRIGPVLDQRIF